MPVRIIYDPNCDRDFSSRYHNQLQQWMNQNHRFAGQSGTVFDFDEAYVLNGLHKTTSTYDPNPVPHVTIRLSTSSLRSQRTWYTLHWRVDGSSVFLPRPDNEESHGQKQAKRREKKQRRQNRGNGGAGRGVPTRGPVPAPPHRSAPTPSRGSTVAPPRGYVAAPSGSMPAPPRGTAPAAPYASASPRGSMPTPPRGTATAPPNAYASSHGFAPPYGPVPPRGPAAPRDTYGAQGWSR